MLERLHFSPGLGLPQYPPRGHGRSSHGENNTDFSTETTAPHDLNPGKWKRQPNKWTELSKGNWNMLFLMNAG